METVGGGGLWNNIGNSRRDAKDYVGAIEAYRKSLAMYAKARKENRPSALQVQKNLNRVLKLQQKAQEGQK
eukprot:4364201-Amphidinium_carterae.1